MNNMRYCRDCGGELVDVLSHLKCSSCGVLFDKPGNPNAGSSVSSNVGSSVNSNVGSNASSNIGSNANPNVGSSANANVGSSARPDNSLPSAPPKGSLKSWAWNWTWETQGQNLIFQRKIGDVMQIFAWFFLIFHALPFCLLLIGFVEVYILLAWIFNVKTVTVNRDKFSIRTAPFPNPFDPDKDFKSNEITQLYCVKKAQYTRRGTRYSYDIMCIFKSGNKVKLLGFSDYQQAKSTEKLIEDFLGIENVAVAGEYKG